MPTAKKPGSTAKKPAAKKSVAKKFVAKKSAAKKSPSKKPTAKKPAAKKSVAKKSAAKKSVAKKVAAKKVATKKSVTKKVATKKSAAKKPVAKKPAAKKSAAKKPATRKSAGKTPAPVPDTSHSVEATPSFMVSALAAELGTPDPALLAALLQDTPDSELVDRGTQIGSLRVVTDGTRMFGIGWTFYKSATAEQKEVLRGCSRELFALGVAETLRLETLLNQQTAQQKSEGGVRKVNAVAEGSAWTYAMNLRDQAAEALRSAAGSREQRTAVSEAVGTAESSMTLALGVEALAKLLEVWLKKTTGTADADQALKLRLELFALDAGYAHKLRRAAEALRKSSANVQNRPQIARVSQVQLDRQDGLCLLILDRAMRAFERGHALDPTIPRLIPLATRNVLGRTTSPRKGKPAIPAPAPAPSPTPAAG